MCYSDPTRRKSRTVQTEILYELRGLHPTGCPPGNLTTGTKNGAQEHRSGHSPKEHLDAELEAGNKQATVAVQPIGLLHQTNVVEQILRKGAHVVVGFVGLDRATKTPDLLDTEFGPLRRFSITLFDAFFAELPVQLGKGVEGGQIAGRIHTQCWL